MENNPVINQHFEPSLFMVFDGEHCIYVTENDFSFYKGKSVSYLCNHRVRIVVPFENKPRFEELFHSLLVDGVIVLCDE